MEFFLSKMWAGLCGVMLLGACTASILDLGHSSSTYAEQEKLEQLGQEVDDACLMTGESLHTVFLKERFPDDKDIVEIRQGSIWLVGPGKSYARALLSTPVVLDANGDPISPGGVVLLHQNDILLIKKNANGSCTLRPQSANVAATLRTA